MKTIGMNCESFVFILIAATFRLVCIEAASAGLATSDIKTCALIKVNTYSRDFEHIWTGEPPSDLISDASKSEESEEDRHPVPVGLDSFTLVEHGANWTFDVSAVRDGTVAVQVRGSYPKDYADLPNNVYMTATVRSPGGRKLKWSYHHEFMIAGIGNHGEWYGDTFAHVHWDEFSKAGEQLKIYIHVRLNYANESESRSSGSACLDPNSLIAESSTNTETTKDQKDSRVNRIVLAWTIDNPGRYFALGEKMEKLTALALKKDQIGGKWFFIVRLWNFDTFKSIELLVNDLSFDEILEDCKMQATLSNGRKFSKKMDDISRYLRVSKRAEMQVGDGDLKELQDMMTILITFDLPTP